MSNVIQVYKLDPARKYRLVDELEKDEKKRGARQEAINKVHEELTGVDCPNYFDMGAQGLNLLAACATPRALVFKIDL